jgi:threonine dehydrogenase-like Zn-dependent dehydrogenase
MAIEALGRQDTFENALRAIRPGGKERMRRLMAMIQTKRVDLTPLVTHQYGLDDIEEAFDLFSHQRDGVLKVALYPAGVAAHRNTESVLTGVGATHR